MGLDIYAHKISRAVADKYELSMDSERVKIHDALDKETKIAFESVTKGMLRYLYVVYKKQTPDEYRTTYIAFIKRLKKKIPMYRNYDYKLGSLGYNSYNNSLERLLTPDEVSEVFKNELKHCFAPEDVYFRKVNFVYAFFSNEMVNESCIVDKTRIGQLKDACEDVLAHKGNVRYAQRVLPTQGGFFFGSTEYDDWYWHDVKDCLTKIKRLYKSMEEGEFVLWDFSW
jgi:hypothetical protein